VAYQSFLPSLVSREQLVEGNSKLETSRSAAWIAGPGVAGWLVQVLGPPLAVVFDALSFAVSGTLIWLIRVRESAPSALRTRRGVWPELTEGLRFAFRNPYLRAIAGSSATSNLFDAVQLAVFVLYVTRDLEITPGVLGLILAIGNVGLLLGALGVGRVTERFGVGRTILGAATIMGIARLVVPFAAGPIELAVGLLVVAQFCTSLGRMLYNVSHLSLRQAITPDAMLGRVNASMRFVAWGAFPLGALLGGLLGEAIGLRGALLVGGLGGLLAIAWIQLSPVPALSRTPSFADEEPGLSAGPAS
jgi:predicted MFS family arabinose efflux permease